MSREDAGEQSQPTAAGGGGPDAVEAQRARLRELCRPVYDQPRPAAINVFGWIMTGLGALASLVFLVLLCVSVVELLNRRLLAGEGLLAAGVGLVYALFWTRVWHGFRTLPDWRVAPDVPMRLKVFAATGSALCASFAGQALARLILAICARTLFVRWMAVLGAGGLSRVEFIVGSGASCLFFLLLWYLFQAMAELRAWARIALYLVLGMALGASASLMAAGALVDLGAVGLALLLMVWHVLVTRGEDVVRSLRADEP